MDSVEALSAWGTSSRPSNSRPHSRGPEPRPRTAAPSGLRPKPARPQAEFRAPPPTEFQEHPRQSAKEELSLQGVGTTPAGQQGELFGLQGWSSSRTLPLRSARQHAASPRSLAAAPISGLFRYSTDASRMLPSEIRAVVEGLAVHAIVEPQFLRLWNSACIAAAAAPPPRRVLEKPDLLAFVGLLQRSVLYVNKVSIELMRAEIHSNWRRLCALCPSDATEPARMSFGAFARAMTWALNYWESDNDPSAFASLLKLVAQDAERQLQAMRRAPRRVSRMTPRTGRRQRPTLNGGMPLPDVMLGSAVADGAPWRQPVQRPRMVVSSGSASCETPSLAEAERAFFFTISEHADGETPRPCAEALCRSEGYPKTRLTATFPMPPSDGRWPSAFAVGMPPKSC